MSPTPAHAEGAATATSGAPATGSAPTTTTALPTGQEAAKRHFQQGVVLFEDNNFEAALVEFEAARGQSREPVILYNIGLCQRSLFRYTDAIATFSSYLDQTSGDRRVSPEQRREVTQAITEMTALLADVTITIQPAGAARSDSLVVSIDGRRVAAPDRPLKLAPGRHVIEIAASGFASARREISVVAGTPQIVPVVLEIAQIPTARAPPRSDSTAALALDVQSRSTEEPRTPARFYKTWWFWTGVGVLVAGGVTTGVLLSRPAGPTLVDGTLGGKTITP